MLNINVSEILEKRVEHLEEAYLKASLKAVEDYFNNPENLKHQEMSVNVEVHRGVQDAFLKEVLKVGLICLKESGNIFCVKLVDKDIASEKPTQKLKEEPQQEVQQEKVKETVQQVSPSFVVPDDSIIFGHSPF